jgi:hypothetical protein
MAVHDEDSKKSLTELNQQMVEMEQKAEDSPEAAREYFRPRLSDQLMFRRANGTVVGKADFLDGLKNNPFQERSPEDVFVCVQDDRALVTLIVVGKRKDDGAVHRYRNIRAFSRSGEQWTMEFWYNYEIPDL